MIVGETTCFQTSHTENRENIFCEMVQSKYYFDALIDLTKHNKKTAPNFIRIFILRHRHKTNTENE